MTLTVSTFKMQLTLKAYSALSLVFSTNVVCVKTQQKPARINHHEDFFLYMRGAGCSLCRLPLLMLFPSFMKLIHQFVPHCSVFSCFLHQMVAFGSLEINFGSFLHHLGSGYLASLGLVFNMATLC